MRLKTLWITVAVLSLAACDMKSAYDKFIPKEDKAFGESYFSSLQARDFDSLEARVDPKLRTPDLRAKLADMATLFPATERPLSVEAVGANTFITPELSQDNLTLQFHFSGGWVLGNLVIQRKGDQVAVMGIHVQPIADSLENLNRFTLAGKGWVHLAALVVAILVPSFIIFCLILCIRTPIPQRKWLWLLITLMGIGQFSFNWATGQIAYKLFAFQLFSCGAFKMGPYAPWVFVVSAPVGAIVFLVKRRHWLVASASVPVPQAEAN